MPGGEAGRLVDRERELASLRALADRRGPTLALLYGRRRVGKTYLLDRAWPRRRVFYFLAAASTSDLNRRDLLRDLAGWSGRELSPEDYPTWRTTFRLLADLASDEPLIVVLDEFQYLLGGPDDVASQLVAVWDREVRRRRLTLVLSGSEIGTLEGLLGGGQPLHGRFEWIHRLAPFDYLDARRMVPERGDREAAQFYGAFGGMPSYLAAVRRGETVGQAVTRALLAPQGVVRLQLEGLIEQERGIREPALYRSVLAAIAGGASGRNEIAMQAGLAERPHAARPVLERLEGLGVIGRERNFGAASNAPFQYRIADHAVRFWYRFVHPHRSQLQVGDPRQVWRLQVAPALDTYMGRVFERICEEGFGRRHAVWGYAPPAEWARWEGQDRNRRSIEIDVVARLADGRVLTGEVKWSSRPADVSLHHGLLRDLEDLAASGQPWAHESLRAAGSAGHIYFCAGGFTPGLWRAAREHGGIRLVDLGGLYRGG